MQVLVVGGSRFIGRAVVNRLLMDSHRVTLLNRGRTPDPFGTRVSRVIGDRTEPDSLRRALARRDFDVVVDLVAFREEDSRSAAELFRSHVGHFFHISTASVYLIRERVFCPFREEDFEGRLAPRSRTDRSSWLYAYHKRRCELVLRQAWEQHRFPFTALRLPMVVGVDDYTERSHAYLERLLDGGPVILPDGGLNSWGFLWANDVAEVIVANLMNGNSMGQAYNLAQREVVSVRQFVETAAGVLGVRPQLASLSSEWLQRLNLGTSFSPYSHDHDIVLHTEAARRDLLFEPTPFPVWCRELAEHHRSLPQDRKSRHYATRALELQLIHELTGKPGSPLGSASR